MTSVFAAIITIHGRPTIEAQRNTVHPGNKVNVWVVPNDGFVSQIDRTWNKGCVFSGPQRRGKARNLRQEVNLFPVNKVFLNNPTD